MTILELQDILSEIDEGLEIITPEGKSILGIFIGKSKDNMVTAMIETSKDDKR